MKMDAQARTAESTGRTQATEALENDRALVAGAQDGDCAAFGAVYELYADRVYRYVGRWLRETADAEDVTSEVFIRAFSSIGRYRWQGKSILAWLYVIARNAAIDHSRRQRPAVAIEETVSIASDEPSLLDCALRMEQMDALRVAMEELTDEQRSVVRLRFFDDLTVAQSAEQIGKRPGAVRTLQFRALSHLRRTLATPVECGSNHAA